MSEVEAVKVNTAMPVCRPKLDWHRTGNIEQDANAAPTSNGHVLDDEFFTVGDGGQSPRVEPGVHRLVLQNVERRVQPNRWEPEKGDMTNYVWSFHLANDPDAREGVFLFFSGTTKKSKTLATVLSAFGLPPGGFHKSDVVGKEVQGLVKRSEGGFPKLCDFLQ